jgi:prepilin-type N-terminal cleavage/methylation domain-containing protein
LKALKSRSRKIRVKSRVKLGLLDQIDNRHPGAPHWVLGVSNMKKRRGFTLIELLVVIALIALLMAILMPVLRKVRQQARTVVCTSRLRQWNIIINSYVTDNGEFFTGAWPKRGTYWLLQLLKQYQSYKVNKIWLCPEATKTIYDEDGFAIPKRGFHNAWGIFHGAAENGYPYPPGGIAGSYALNGYFIQITGKTYLGSGVPSGDGWWDHSAEGDTPLMVGATRPQLWPTPADAPPQTEAASWTCETKMGSASVDRHGDFVCASFWDGSTRKVGLKELWTLKWHKSFSVAGPRTGAGGVQPEDWPEWMRNYRDY